MTWSLIKVIIILPGTALVFVPAAIGCASRGTRFSLDFQYPPDITFWLAMSLVSARAYIIAVDIPELLKKAENRNLPKEKVHFKEERFVLRNSDGPKPGARNNARPHAPEDGKLPPPSMVSSKAYRIHQQPP